MISLRRKMVDRQRWFVPVLMLGVLFLGCSSSAPPDLYYNLKVKPSSAGAGHCRLPGVLIVNRPVADALVDERGLVYQPNAASPKLRRHTYHMWADPPTVMIQNELADYLKKQGVADTIVTPSVRARADYALNSNLIEMQRVLGDSHSIVLAMEFSLIRLQDRKVLVQFSGVETRPAADIDAAVQAYEGAALALFDGFLADCNRQLGAPR